MAPAGILNVWGEGFASVLRTGGPTVNVEVDYNDIFDGRNTADAALSKSHHPDCKKCLAALSNTSPLGPWAAGPAAAPPHGRPRGGSMADDRVAPHPPLRAGVGAPAPRHPLPSGSFSTEQCLVLFESPSHSRKSARHFLLATSGFSTEQADAFEVFARLGVFF